MNGSANSLTAAGAQPAGVSAAARRMRKGAYAAVLLGMAFAILLIAHLGAGAVLEAFIRVEWGLLWVALFHVLPMMLATLAWRALFPLAHRPALLTLMGVRWIKEAVADLLPAAQVGGDVVRARLLMLLGFDPARVLAGVTADLTVSVLAQVVFSLLGLVLLVSVAHGAGEASVKGAAASGSALLGIAVLGFYRLQRRGLFSLLARLGRRVRAIPLSSIADAASTDEAIRATYRDRRAVLVSLAWRMAGEIAGACEIWLAFYFLDRPVSFIDALVLESLVQVLRSAAFAVPAAVGVQEGAHVLIGTLLGLDLSVVLALSLVKRVRDLLLGLPGLLAWQMLEGRHFLTPGGRFLRGRHESREHRR